MVKVFGTGKLLVVFFCILFSFAATRAAQFSCQALSGPPQFQANPNWTIGTKRLLIYRVKFTDTTDEIVTEAKVHELASETNARFQHMSYGKFALDWVITPILDLPRETDFYRNQGFNAILSETRSAAAKAGFNFEQFDLDLVHCPTIPGLLSGQANLGEKGAFVQVSLASLYLHELGHNLGLFHANSWEFSRPRLHPKSTPPFPGNFTSYTEPFAFDPASLIGNGDLRTPGQTIEYGDVYDLMGGGAGDFNASFKQRLYWLAPENILTVSSNGIYRVYAHDQGSSSPDRAYGLRLSPILEGRGQNFSMRYWISFRSSTPPNANVPLGVELHWMDSPESYVSNLLDTQPGTSRLMWDSPLALGRSFHDSELNLHITPLTLGSTDRSLWIDLQIVFGSDQANRAPSLDITTDKSTASPGEDFTFTATASDPDSDPISFFWNFGDDTWSGAQSQVTKSFSADGHFLVLCTASDGKGGKTTRQLLVQVGQVQRFKVQGRLLTDQGEPLAGVRVHNGRVDDQFGFMNDYVLTETDSAGRYTISNLQPGKYKIAAALYGFQLQRSPADGPIIVDADVANVDFVATSLPTISVTASPSKIKEGQSTTFTFRRTGPLDQPLSLQFIPGGTAALGQDYKPFISQNITIPSGADSATLTLETLPDLDEDPLEKLTLSALPASTFTRTIQTDQGPQEITYFYPGWEPRATTTGEEWVQTMPSFRIDPLSSATVEIEDTTTPGLQRIFVVSEAGTALERPRQAGNFRIERIGSTAFPLTVKYELRGDARNGIDYELLPGTVEIPAGTNSVFIYVLPIADDELEELETVQCVLTPSPEYQVTEPPSEFVTIREDEFNSGPNTLYFSEQWGGGTVISIKGQTGKTYVLEFSTDLKSWSPLSTNELIFSPISVSVPLFDLDHAFYRTFALPNQNQPR